MKTSDLNTQESELRKEGYNCQEQLIISVLICAIAFSCYVPYLLNWEVCKNDDYDGYIDATLIDIMNTVTMSFTALMILEACLDSSTFYIPIKIAFPRFITVFGIFVISVSKYFQPRHGVDRLSYYICSHFAKGYIICGGLILELLKDAINAKSWKLWLYSIVTAVFAIDLEVHLLGAYFVESASYAIFKNFVAVLGVIVAVYFVFVIFQLICSKDRSVYHAYGLMSHLVVCVYFFGVYVIVYSFEDSVTWTDSLPAELASYESVDLFSTVLFFFTSSQIAQRHFVSAKGQLATKRMFVRSISHEIRTPLNTAFLGIQLLATKISELAYVDTNALLSAKAKLEEILKDVNDSCRISINILNDLLLIDKIEEGSLVLDKSEINAKALLESSIQNFDVQAIYSQINLSADVTALNNVTVVVDESKLSQVIRNVISNALKFTPAGGGIQVNTFFTPQSSPADRKPLFSPRVHVECCSQPGTVRIEVLDTGPGITEENKAKLFGQVVQFDPNLLQKGGGSGLGMWISNAIMKSHGGTIGVMPGGVEKCDSSSDREFELCHSPESATGSLFYIEMTGTRILPDHNRDEVSPFQQSSTSPPSERRDKYLKKEIGTGSTMSTISTESSVSIHPVSNHLRTKTAEYCNQKLDKILVVEDSTLNRKMMQSILLSYANEVLLAEDGLEGVRHVRECVEQEKAPFDVIFMDSLMPNMNGIEATRKILQELHFPNPIVAVTGNMLPDDINDFKDAGAYAVLGKPLEVDKLEEVLRDIRMDNIA